MAEVDMFADFIRRYEEDQRKAEEARMLDQRHRVELLAKSNNMAQFLSPTSSSTSTVSPPSSEEPVLDPICVAAATSMIDAVPSGFNDTTPSTRSTKCSNVAVDITASAAVFSTFQEPFADPIHSAVMPTASTAVSSNTNTDTPAKCSVMGLNIDMGSSDATSASPTFIIANKLFLDRMHAAVASTAITVVTSNINADVPSTRLMKCSSGGGSSIRVSILIYDHSPKPSTPNDFIIMAATKCSKKGEMLLCDQHLGFCSASIVATLGTWNCCGFGSRPGLIYLGKISDACLLLHLYS